MKKLLFIPLVAITLLLTGCCSFETDQIKRERIFKECLEKVPAGPTTVKYNDWNEVVKACENSAYYISQTKVCN